MRTTKRFSPAVLGRFARQGRGTGTFGNYRAWHQVSRSDPASRGRSHIICWQEFQLDLLSDKERAVFLFASMHPNLIDVRPQFPLALEASPHELEAYGEARISSYPGFSELAAALKIRAPKLRDGSDEAPWVPTTDLLLTIENEQGNRALIAIAFKYARELLRKRAWQLLKLEREYWLRREVQWLLITETLFDRRYAECLERVWWWALHCPVDEDSLQRATSVIRRGNGRPLIELIARIAERAGDLPRAQHAFWQAVWKGLAPIELRRGWRPHVPVQLLSVEDFQGLNPILSGRSAWIG